MAQHNLHCEAEVVEHKITLAVTVKNLRSILATAERRAKTSRTSSEDEQNDERRRAYG